MGGSSVSTSTDSMLIRIGQTLIVLNEMDTATPADDSLPHSHRQRSPRSTTPAADTDTHPHPKQRHPPGLKPRLLALLNLLSWHHSAFRTSWSPVGLQSRALPPSDHRCRNHEKLLDSTFMTVHPPRRESQAVPAATSPNLASMGRARFWSTFRALLTVRPSPGKDPLARRTRLSRAQRRPGPGPLRRPQLHRLPPPRHPRHRRPGLLHPAAQGPKSPCAGLSVYHLLRELQVILAIWTGTCPTCTRTLTLDDLQPRHPT